MRRAKWDAAAAPKDAAADPDLKFFKAFELPAETLLQRPCILQL